MRKKVDLKTVRKTVLMTAETAKDIEREAEERGVKPNAVMNDRLRHSKDDNTPPVMMQFQNYAKLSGNCCYNYCSRNNSDRNDCQCYFYNKTG